MGVLHSKWVGLEHFVRFFTNESFFLLFRNTMMISLLSLIFFFPLPILLSICMNEVTSKYFKRTVQTIVYLPHFLSWVIIAGITFLLLSDSYGIVNKLFVFFGYQKFDFLTNSSTFWGLLTVHNICKDTGWGTNIF